MAAPDFIFAPQGWIRDKAGTGLVHISDLLGGLTSSGSSARLSALEQTLSYAPSTPSSALNAFALATTGNMVGQDQFKQPSGSSATLVKNADGTVSAAGPYNSGGAPVRLERLFAEGEITINFPANGQFIAYPMQQSDGAGYVLFATNNGIEFGHTNNAVGTGAIGLVSYNPTSQVPFPSGPYSVSWRLEDRRIELRVWPQSGSRPASPTLSRDLSGSDPILNEGFIGFGSISGTNVYQSLTVDSGQFAPNSLEVQARFEGFWFPVFRAGVLGMATLNQSSEFSSLIRGSSSVSAQFYVSPLSTQAPIIAVSVDDAGFTRVPVTGSGWVTISLASGLSLTDSHRVQIVAAGIHENDPVWSRDVGLIFGGFVAAGASIRPTSDPRRRILFLGDSITAGIVALAAPPSLPSKSAGESTYARIAADLLGAVAIVRGFGGIGLTQGGSGGVPNAIGVLDHFDLRRSIQRFGNPGAIVINLGTNDSAASSSAFTAALSAYVARVRQLYPGRPIALIRPFNGTKAAEVQAVASSGGLGYVDTSSYGLTYNDGLHPDLAGHLLAGQKLAADLKTVLGLT